TDIEHCALVGLSISNQRQPSLLRRKKGAITCWEQLLPATILCKFAKSADNEQSAYLLGMKNTKFEPSPTSESILMVPSSFSTRRLTIARPMQVPSPSMGFACARRSNRSNTFLRSFS